eukprot:CFRG4402T1
MSGNYSQPETTQSVSSDHGAVGSDMAIEKANERVKAHRYIVGLIFLLFVVIIWVGSSVLMKFIYSGSETNFNKPFFLSFYNASMFSVYLLGFLWRPKWREESPSWSQFKAYFSSSGSAIATNDDEQPLLRGEHGRANSKTLEVDEHRRMNTAEVFHAAAVFSLLWFAGNYAFNLALTMTSVSAVTIISSTSGFWTMLIEWVVLGTDDKQLSVLKLALIAISIAGVVMVTLSDAQHSSTDPTSAPVSPNAESSTFSAIGDVIALLSSALYGVYLVFLERRIKSDKRLDMTMFFGFVGLCSILLLWPWFIVLHMTGLETFMFPPLKTWGYLTLNALIGTVLSDYLWLYATLLTTPVVATLALSLTIPLALIVDSFTKSIDMDATFVWGSLFVCSAFVGMNLASHEPYLKHLHELVENICGRRVAMLLTGHRSLHRS